MDQLAPATQSPTAKAPRQPNKLAGEGGDHNAAVLAQSAAEHLSRAWAFQREPILREAAEVERITAAVQLRQALEYLEQAA